MAGPMRGNVSNSRASAVLMSILPGAVAVAGADVDVGVDVDVDVGNGVGVGVGVGNGAACVAAGVSMIIGSGPRAQATSARAQDIRIIVR